MPTDRQPTEQEMAREALRLIAAKGDALLNDPLMRTRLFPFHHRASSLLRDFGPCPGFWGEVLAAVRVLRGDPRVHLSADHPAGWVVLATVTASIIGGWTEIGEGPTEPAAILAALRAVVGATDA